MAIACFVVCRVYARRMEAKPRGLRPGNLAHRPPKLNISSTPSTSTPFARVALPQQPSLLFRATSHPASSHQKFRPQRRRVSQVRRSCPNKRIYATYVSRITYLTFWTDACLPSFVIGTRPTAHPSRKSLPCGWPVETGHLREHGNQHPCPFPGTRLRALPTFSVPVPPRRFATQVSWIRRIYPISVYTHLTGQKWRLISHSTSIRATDTMDVLLRHISRDDDAAPLASMYVIS